ncbi:hypothetical protein AXF42_Ash012788 [Apostasia shenzhenica]|uniref:Pectinesterase inhibitor domain-containing protein n=1 Tax=Apostasia shenzhenica TaxID=1088818 RepID=A0A2I0AM57_9ASPA|nr:hypothetical protein AXF42_Ash012788 [Apostasia shenzhenica]
MAAISFLFLLLLLSSSAVCAAATSPEIHEACKSLPLPRLLRTADLTGSISSLPQPPGDIIVSIFNATIRSLPAAVSKVQAKSPFPPATQKRTAAASSCLEVLFFSSRRLAAAAADPNLSSSARRRSWTGAAHHYLSGCFLRPPGTSGAPARSRTPWASSPSSPTSPATPRHARLPAALRRRHLHVGPPETERDGYWGYPPSSPTTVTSRDFQ